MTEGGGAKRKKTSVRTLPLAAGAHQPDVRFGSFLLSRRGEALYRNGQMVRLGSRARHILTLLVHNAGETLAKRDLMDIVWPHTTVVEANLTVHIAALRQALGEVRGGPQYIVNVPGRGYRFVADVRLASPLEGVANDGEQPAHNNLPARLTSAIGREDALGQILTRMNASSIVTVTGAAGVGKTTLAILAAEASMADYVDGVWFVDLSPVVEAAHVVSALTSVFRVEQPNEGGLDSFIKAFRSQNLLLVIDNCEHVIEAAASLATAIAAECPHVRIIATSRQPLHVEGESLFRLPPLEVPPKALTDAGDVLCYPAVQLLAQRAASASSDFEINNTNALSAAAICRRLDGLPLAIEFASALIDAFGLQGLAAHLEDNLLLSEIDRRGSSPRHRTLEAALEWSYRLLQPVEQIVLRRLSIFSGGFTMDAAATVVCGPDEDIDVGGILAGLTLKSLITTDVTGPDLRLRLLETTRAFALSHLTAAGEFGTVADRHAAYYRDYLRARNDTMGQRDIDADVNEIDNLRSALRHTLEPLGDIELALGLAVAGLPVWFGLSLLNECRSRLREIGERLTPAQRVSGDGWALSVAIRAAEMFTQGTPRSDFSAWERPHDQGGTFANMDSTVADLLTNWTWNIRLPDYAEMMRLAGLHATMVRRDGTIYDQVMSAWIMGLSTHHVGDPLAARDHLSRFLSMERIEDRRIFLGNTGFDRTPGGQAILAATLCQLGEVRSGFVHARRAEEEGRRTGKALPMCEALMWVGAAMLIAHETSGTLETLLDDLICTAADFRLESHHGVGLGLLGIHQLRTELYEPAEHNLARALSMLTSSHYGPFTPWLTGAYACALALQRRFSEAITSIKRFREQDINGVSWCTPEMLRLEAVVLRLAGEPADRISKPLLDAIAIAERQGALAWMTMAEIERVEASGITSQSNLGLLRERLAMLGASALVARIDRVLPPAYQSDLDPKAI